MNLSLKKLLSQLTALHISKKDDSSKKIDSILNIFVDKVINSTNKEKCLNYIYDKRVNFILIDIECFDSKGIEFIKEVRKNGYSIPILVITENTKTSNLIEAIKLNLVDYLLKPIDNSKFIHSLNQIAKIILNNGDIITTIYNDTKYSYIDKSIVKDTNKQKLTKNESQLLELFLSNRGKIIKYGDIKRVIWTNKEVSDSAFKSLLSRLSNKLGKDVITNSFGVGYGIVNQE